MKHILLLLLLGAVSTNAAAPAQQFTKAQLDFYETKVRPVLSQTCYKCHSATSEKIKAGLVVDTREGLLKGGETGPAVIPGNAEKSLLIKAIRYTDNDLQMPPKGEKLSAQQIADLTAWVKMGAPAPAGGKAPLAKAVTAAAAKTSHWAFQPVKKLNPPTVKQNAAVQNPVDAFIIAKLEEKEMKPSVQADKRTLIRRATFDLIGLPPTPDEVDAFLEDNSTDAFKKVVERLLASERYGERWGRYWLDTARYSDTKGEVKRKREDERYPFAWTYRDYVIKAFNDDKPYDRFILEQIAADKLGSGTDKNALAALGFLTLGERFMNNKNDIINDRIDVVTKGTLALTVACARCHDHKFDPIPMADYYSLRGVFNSCFEPKDGVAMASSESNPYYADFQKKLAPLQRQLAATESQMKVKGKGAAAAKNKKQLQAQKAKIEGQIADLETTHPGSPPHAMVLLDDSRPTDSPIFLRGEAENVGPVVPRRFLEVLSGPTRPNFKNGSGRIDLAQAIVSKSNPLTARVMVNRIWLHHFGEGFVTTPDDFGTMAAPPSHPELLDYLATYFMDHNWSIKEMHRLIMLSGTYQQSSANNPRYAQVDPYNRLLWRANIRRLEFEALRDSFLAIGGKLDLKMGGPSVALTSEPYSTRRSVYGYIDRAAVPEVMNLFDFANPDMTTGRRYETIVPQQSLFLMNSPLVVEAARNIVRRPEFISESDPETRVEMLYDLVYQREPTPQEVQLSLRFVSETKYVAPPVVKTDTAPANNRVAAKKAKSKKRPGAVSTPTIAHRAPLGAWEEFAHTLFIANEASFVN